MRHPQLADLGNEVALFVLQFRRPDLQVRASFVKAKLR